MLQINSTIETPKYSVIDQLNVLIVDDLAINRKMAASVCKNICPDINVSLAETGEETIKMIQDKYFHVILLDYHLGINKQTGEEIAEIIDAIQKDLSAKSKIITWSSIKKHEGERYPKACGLLKKPIEPNEAAELFIRFKLLKKMELF